jgi:hypothetical protein
MENDVLDIDVKDTCYYHLQSLYGRDHNWIMEKIGSFVRLYRDIRDNGYRDPIVVLTKPLIANQYHCGIEIYEGHHRLACCLALGIHVLLCRVIVE